jgi:hypothetical protein
MTLENATAASTTAGSVGLVCTTCDTKYPCVHVIVRARARMQVCAYIMSVQTHAQHANGADVNARMQTSDRICAHAHTPRSALPAAHPFYPTRSLPQKAYLLAYPAS